MPPYARMPAQMGLYPQEFHSQLLVLHIVWLDCHLTEYTTYLSDNTFTHENVLLTQNGAGGARTLLWVLRKALPLW